MMMMVVCCCFSNHRTMLFMCYCVICLFRVLVDDYEHEVMMFVAAVIWTKHHVQKIHVKYVGLFVCLLCEWWWLLYAGRMLYELGNAMLLFYAAWVLHLCYHVGLRDFVGGLLAMIIVWRWACALLVETLLLQEFSRIGWWLVVFAFATVSLGAGQSGHFLGAPETMSFCLMKANITNMPSVDLCWPFAMLSCAYSSNYFIKFHNLFLIHISSKNLEIFSSWSWMCPSFNCDF